MRKVEVFFVIESFIIVGPYDIQTVFNDQHMYLENNWPESSATLNTLVHRMSSTTFEEPG